MSQSRSASHAQRERSDLGIDVLYDTEVRTWPRIANSSSDDLDQLIDSPVWIMEMDNRVGLSAVCSIRCSIVVRPCIA